MNKEKWSLPLGKRKSSGKKFSTIFFLPPPGCPIQEILEVVGKFPTVFTDEMNLSLEEEVSEPELKETLFSMSNGKIPGPDRVTVEFFKAFYDLLKEDLLLMIRESQKEGRVHGPLNTTFLCLIPKKQCPSSFEDYRPIACCNVVYKLITKIISRRLRPMLSEIIGEEKFGFLHNRQIHDVVAIAQEVLHSVKKINLKDAILKLDLSKAYDRVNWTFLHLVLIQMGMSLKTINWIMGCIQSASFAILINGAPSNFFKASRGLRQGCPLSPFLFLIIAEALSLLIKEARSKGLLRGIAVSESESITHLLFVDDIFCCLHDSQRNLSALKDLLNLFCSATGMKINMEKSCLLLHHCENEEEASIANTFPAQRKNFSDGLKYLGFNLKPDNYRKEDWGWLIRKVEAHLAIWVNRLLSRGGRLVLIKAVLEGIPVYWNSIVEVPKGVLDHIRRLSFRFLWKGQNAHGGPPLVKWNSIGAKRTGGLGVKKLKTLRASLSRQKPLAPNFG
jgi:hypothetical protein